MYAANRPAVGKVICFRCRRSDCVGPCGARSRRTKQALARTCAWVSGACLAGSVLGAALALLFGG